MTYENLTLERKGNVFIITLHRAPENRFTMRFCQEVISAFHDLQRQLGNQSDGAIITRGCDSKFFSTGLDLDERVTNPYASTDGFYPMLHTILDCPYPTIACITGHTFGGSCLFALAHDYRIMNSDRGYFQMPPVNLGLHFDGMGALLRAKLNPQVRRKVLLEAHRYKADEALRDGIVDAVGPPDKIFSMALSVAERWKAKAKMDVYGVLRGELVGEAARAFQLISHVHNRATARNPKVKL